MSAVILFCKFVKWIGKDIIREKVICQRLYKHSITSENESYHHNYNYNVNNQYIIDWLHLISANAVRSHCTSPYCYKFSRMWSSNLMKTLLCTRLFNLEEITISLSEPSRSSLSFDKSCFNAPLSI